MAFEAATYRAPILQHAPAKLLTAEDARGPTQDQLSNGNYKLEYAKPGNQLGYQSLKVPVASTLRAKQSVRYVNGLQAPKGVFNGSKRKGESIVVGPGLRMPRTRITALRKKYTPVTVKAEIEETRNGNVILMFSREYEQANKRITSVKRALEHAKNVFSNQDDVTEALARFQQDFEQITTGLAKVGSAEQQLRAQFEYGDHPDVSTAAVQYWESIHQLRLRVASYNQKLEQIYTNYPEEASRVVVSMVMLGTDAHSLDALSRIMTESITSRGETDALQRANGLLSNETKTTDQQQEQLYAANIQSQNLALDVLRLLDRKSSRLKRKGTSAAVQNQIRTAANVSEMLRQSVVLQELLTSIKTVLESPETQDPVKQEEELAEALDELHAMKTELEKRNTQIHDMNVQLRQQQAQINTLKHQGIEMERRAKLVSALNHQAEVATVEYRAEIARLEAQVSGHTQQKLEDDRTIAALREESGKYDQEKQQRERTIAALEQEKERIIKEYTNDRETMKDKYQQREVLLEAAKEKITKEAEEREETARIKHAAEVRSLRHQIDAERTKTDRTRTQLLSEQVAWLARNKTMRAQQSGEAGSRSEELEHENADLKKKLDSLEKESLKQAKAALSAQEALSQKHEDEILEIKTKSLNDKAAFIKERQELRMQYEEDLAAEVSRNDSERNRQERGHAIAIKNLETDLHTQYIQLAKQQASEIDKLTKGYVSALAKQGKEIEELHNASKARERSDGLKIVALEKTITGLRDDLTRAKTAFESKLREAEGLSQTVQRQKQEAEKLQRAMQDAAEADLANIREREKIIKDLREESKKSEDVFQKKLRELETAMLKQKEEAEGAQDVMKSDIKVNLAKIQKQEKLIKDLRAERAKAKAAMKSDNQVNLAKIQEQEKLIKDLRVEGARAEAAMKDQKKAAEEALDQAKMELRTATEASSRALGDAQTRLQAHEQQAQSAKRDNESGAKREADLISRLNEAMNQRDLAIQQMEASNIGMKNALHNVADLQEALRNEKEENASLKSLLAQEKAKYVLLRKRYEQGRKELREINSKYEKEHLDRELAISALNLEREAKEYYEAHAKLWKQRAEGEEKKRDLEFQKTLRRMKEQHQAELDELKRIHDEELAKFIASDASLQAQLDAFKKLNEANTFIKKLYHESGEKNPTSAKSSLPAENDRKQWEETITYIWNSLDRTQKTRATLETKLTKLETDMSYFVDGVKQTYGNVTQFTRQIEQELTSSTHQATARSRFPSLLTGHLDTLEVRTRLFEQQAQKLQNELLETRSELQNMVRAEIDINNKFRDMIRRYMDLA